MREQMNTLRSGILSEMSESGSLQLRRSKNSELKLLRRYIIDRSIALCYPLTKDT